MKVGNLPLLVAIAVAAGSAVTFALPTAAYASATPSIATSQQPSSATVGSSIADQATVSYPSYTCPSEDEASFALGDTSDSGGVLFCSYPAYPGESSTDFYCDYNDATGALATDHDSGFCPATAVGGGAGTPTGTVTFNLYDNSAGTGTPLFTDANVSLVSGVATSFGYTATATGTDYWVATYNGDSNYNSVSSGAAAEPVSIMPATPSIDTSQQPSSATVGSSIADQATVSGGYSPTGTVTFNLYDNSAGTGTPLFTDANVSLVSGVATSAGYAPTATGTDYWVATYNGDSNNSSVSSATAGEPVSITPATPTLSGSGGGSVTLGSAVSDSATIAGGYSPGGSVSFALFPGGGCTGTQIGSTVSVSVSGDGSYPSGSIATAPSAGTDSVLVSYAPDSNNSAPSTVCDVYTVAEASPTLTSQASAAATLGASVSDTATLSGGFGATGSIVFKLYGPGDSTCQNTPAFTSPAVSVSGNQQYTSPSFTPTEAGTYLWTASYSGDGNNAGVTGDCGATGESVAVAPVSSTTAVSSSQNPSIAGEPVTFTATVTGTGPTGTVTFMDGTTTLGTGTLSSGTATLTTSSLAVGSHTITAAYGGDTNNAASNSDPLTQVVSVQGLPTVSITTPARGAKYAFGAHIVAAYSCTDGSGGPGIASCTGTVAEGAPINTSHAGAHTFTVTAVSKDGQKATSTVLYRIAQPSNRFQVKHIVLHPDGTVTATVTFPGRGLADLMVTSWDAGVEHAAIEMLQPAANRFVVGRSQLLVRGAGSVNVTVTPNARGKFLVAHPAYPLDLRFWVSYLPTGGTQRNNGYFDVRVGGAASTTPRSYVSGAE